MNKLPMRGRKATTAEELWAIQSLHSTAVKLLKSIAGDLKVTAEHLSKLAASIEEDLDVIG